MASDYPSDFESDRESKPLVTPCFVVGAGEFGRQVALRTRALAAEIDPRWLALTAAVAVDAQPHRDEGPREAGSPGEELLPLASFSLDLGDSPSQQGVGKALEQHAGELRSLFRELMLDHVANAARQAEVRADGYDVDRNEVLICLVGSLAEPLTRAALCDLAALARSVVPGRSHCCALLALGEDELDQPAVSSALKRLEAWHQQPPKQAADCRKRLDVNVEGRLFDRVYLFDAFTQDGRALNWPQEGVSAAANFLTLMLDSRLHEAGERRTRLVGKSGALDIELSTGAPAFLSSFGLVHFRYSPGDYVNRYRPPAARGLMDRCFPQSIPDEQPMPPDESFVDEFMGRHELDRGDVRAGLLDGAAKPEELLFDRLQSDKDRARVPEDTLGAFQDLCRNFPGQEIAAYRAAIERNRYRMVERARETLPAHVDELIRKSPGGLNRVLELVTAVGRRWQAEHDADDRPGTDPDQTTRSWTGRPRVQETRRALAEAITTFRWLRWAVLLLVIALAGTLAGRWFAGLDRLFPIWFLVMEGVLLAAAGGGVLWWSKQRIPQVTEQFRAVVEDLTEETAAEVRRQQRVAYYDQLLKLCDRQLTDLEQLQSVLAATEKRIAAGGETSFSPHGAVALAIPGAEAFRRRAEQIAEHAKDEAERWLREADPLRDWRQVAPEELADRITRFCSDLFVELRELKLEEYFSDRCEPATRATCADLLWSGAGPLLQLSDAIPDLPVEREWWLLSVSGPDCVLAGPIQRTQSAVVCLQSNDPYAISLLTVLHGIPIQAIQRLGR